jgi:hypothetical protein
VTLVPTARLRFVAFGMSDYISGKRKRPPREILQQWFAQDVPDYMRDPKIGEWRDVPVVDLDAQS